MFYLLIILIQMKILLNNQMLYKAIGSLNSVGFVPTMGGIHKGHISLINKSKKVCKKTLVSIFINPKQFNNKNDFKNYPSNINNDLFLLKKTKKVDFVYIPEFNEIYKSKRKSEIILKKKDKILCAKFRKGHFEGVLNVMDRLTKLIKPNKIFMGKKDYQQLYLVKRLIEKKYKTRIIACNTIRAENKYALSSRNFLLKNVKLDKAGKIAKLLINFKKNLVKKENIQKILSSKKLEIEKNYNVKVEYLEARKEKDLLITNNIKKSRIFIAYYLDKVRLIDNF